MFTERSLYRRGTMRLYAVTFTVRAENLEDAVRQSESLLNTADRVVDHDVQRVHGPFTVGRHGWPSPALDPEAP